jgi:predicted flap endonuclease-1-like 5' DNA nuclease
MNFTINEWAIIALVFVLGWLLGLASRSDRHWRQRYEEEHAAHDALRLDHETLQREHDARIASANRRITELERHDPVVATPIAGAATIGTGAAVTAARAMGHHDDLTRIDGIDAHDETRLNEAGVHGFNDIANLSAEDAAGLETRLGFTAGRITSQRWREQAGQLASDRTINSSAHTGRRP